MNRIKINFKLFAISTLVSVGFFSLFFIFSAKTIAQTGVPEDDIVINTVGYSALSPSSYTFQGYYFGNFQKKGLTIYFEYKKVNSNFIISSASIFDLEGVEKTIVIHDSEADEFKNFFISPELQLFSTYIFRAVGYFDDNPDQKFYGGMLSLNTGNIPFGSTYPYTPLTINGGWSVWSSWSACSATSCGTDGIKTRTHTCTNPIPANGGTPCVGSSIDTKSCSAAACVIPNPTVSITAENKNINYGDSTYIFWRSTDTTWCVTSQGANGWDGFTTELFGNFETGALTSNTTYNITCRGSGTSSASGSVTVNVGSPPGEDGEDEENKDPITIIPNSETPAGSTGLVPCTDNCEFNDLIILVNTVISFVFKNMVLPIAAILFAYAGFEFIISKGEPEKRGKAKKIFINVAFGLVIAAAAFLIVQTILGIVGVVRGDGWHWFGF